MVILPLRKAREALNAVYQITTGKIIARRRAGWKSLKILKIGFLMDNNPNFLIAEKRPPKPIQKTPVWN